MTLPYPSNIVADLYAAGIRLRVEEGELRVRGQTAALTPDLLARVRDHKAALLELVGWLQEASAELSRREAEIREGGSGTLDEMDRIQRGSNCVHSVHAFPEPGLSSALSGKNCAALSGKGIRFVPPPTRKDG